jgi:sulfite reductase (NADPH) flavoprotein alpha-component
VIHDPVRLCCAAGAVLLWLLLVGWTAWRNRPRRAPASAAGAVPVVFASQTGFAESLAEMTAQALESAGTPVRLMSIAELDAATLAATGRVLIVASTTGEGDPPDSAARFVRRVMGETPDLAGLSYGLLVLGDRSYDRFCGFGHALDDWLRRSGARPLFDAVEVDNGEAGAIRHWQHQLTHVTGKAPAADWAPPAYGRWRLAERRLLNTGSPGGEAYHLALEPVGERSAWAAGDIAEVGLPDGVGSREYSIASLPSDGGVELLVRLMRHPDGTPGAGSGWLTRELAEGGEVPMRIRANRSFHAPDDPATPLILIGAGTGLAGLRAHLKARAERPGGEAWLLFGERTAAHDSFHDAELRGWLAAGVLARLDRVFSRDGGAHRYVQDLVDAHAAEVVAWVARGAAVYVCGSVEGMAPGVHAALERALGAEGLAELLETGRYRRDVY